MIRKLTADEVEFQLECELDDCLIKGNVSAIDEETDRKAEEWVRQQLNSGNVWAWCTVTVRAVWKQFEGVDHLGACSYKSEESFKKSGYYEDMKATALDDLNSKVARYAEAVAELIK